MTFEYPICRKCHRTVTIRIKRYDTRNEKLFICEWCGYMEYVKIKKEKK